MNLTLKVMVIILSPALAEATLHSRGPYILFYLSELFIHSYVFQVHIPSALSTSGIPPIFSSTGHNIEFVLQTELPLVSSAFKMSGFTPAQVSIDSVCCFR